MAIELQLERGIVLVESRDALEQHAGAEDALDYVCKRAAAAADAGIDIAQARAIARCVSDAQVRALPVVPHSLSTTLSLVTAERGGEGSKWPRLSEMSYRGLAASIQERIVSISASKDSEAAACAAQLSPLLGQAAGLSVTLQSMHDDNFLRAAHTALFDGGGGGG